MVRYQKYIQKALLCVVADILEEVATNGLFGAQHFYISFKTNFAGVQIPSFLKQTYPDEMTIVLQHQFKNLEVFDDSFQVDLSFKGHFQTLKIPFNSLISFADPSEQFMLSFVPEENTPKKEKPTAPKEAEVICLDALRGKK